MKLYRSKGSIWTGTQADAKAAQGGTDYETIEVPTDKPSLLTWLNEFDVRPGERSGPIMIQDAAGNARPLVIPETEPEEAPAPPAEIDASKMRPAQMERFEALAKKLGWTPPGEQSAAPKAISVDDVEEMIFEVEGNNLIRILSSAVSRLGEVAGTRGWAAFAKNTYAWTAGAKNVEQGLGMLMLAAFDCFGMKSEKSDQPTA